MGILANLQLILFFIPVASLAAIGLFILLKPVAIISRRWYLAVVIPMLLANPLALIENNLENNFSLAADWQFWLVLVVDAALLVGSILIFRGYLIFGLGKFEVMDVIAGHFQERGIASQVHAGDRNDKWRVSPNALILTIDFTDKNEDLWVTENMGEIHLRTDSKRSLKIARDAMLAIKRMKKSYIFKQHVMGILYIVLAVVLGVFGWIFFFEPRLIIIE